MDRKTTMEEEAYWIILWESLKAITKHKIQ